MIFAEHVKNKLSSLIHKQPWLFSKKSRINFHGTENLILYLIQFLTFSMESGSLKKELLIISSSLSIPRLLQRYCDGEQTTSGGIPAFLFYEFNYLFFLNSKKV